MTPPTVGLYIIQYKIYLSIKVDVLVYRAVLIRDIRTYCDCDFDVCNYLKIRAHLYLAPCRLGATFFKTIANNYKLLVNNCKFNEASDHICSEI